MRSALVYPLLATFALPATAQSPQFSLGLEALFEHQESLEVSAFSGSIRTRDLLRGTEEPGALPGDPALLNRKFNLLWELKGAGVQLPIELPKLGVFSSRAVLEAAIADVSLDFLDRTVPADSTSLSGRGPLFAAELELEGFPWGIGPWSAGASLRWQKLPSLTMERSPVFSPDGFQVMNDEVNLSQEVQEITTRFGYTTSSGRTKSYLGVRHRRTDVEIGDDLGYVDSLRQIETNLSSQIQLESEATLAVAGIETRVGTRFRGRVETAVGEGDQMVQIWGAYLLSAGVPDKVKTKQRASQIAAEIIGPLRELEAELERWRPCLERRTCEAAELIDLAESSLLRILNAPELAGLREWAMEEFQKVRQAERLPGGIEALAIPTSGRNARPPWAVTTRATSIVVFAVVIAIVRRPRELAESDDLLTNLCLRDPSYATFYFWPSSDPGLKVDRPSPGDFFIYRGLYLYGVKRTEKIIGCLPARFPSEDCPSVNLVRESLRVVDCDFYYKVCTFQKELPNGCPPRR